MTIRRLILDVLVPHQPDVLEYAGQLSDVEGTDAVSVTVVEQDEHTRTIEVVLEGSDIRFDAIKAMIEQLGGSVHSIDHVSAGRRFIGLDSSTVGP